MGPTEGGRFAKQGAGPRPRLAAPRPPSHRRQHLRRAHHPEVTPSPPPSYHNQKPVLIGRAAQYCAPGLWTRRMFRRAQGRGTKALLNAGGVGLPRRSTIQFPIPWGVIQGCRAPDGPPPCGGAPGPGGPEPTAVLCRTKPATGDSFEPMAIVFLIYSF